MYFIFSNKIVLYSFCVKTSSGYESQPESSSKFGLQKSSGDITKGILNNVFALSIASLQFFKLYYCVFVIIYYLYIIEYNTYKIT